MALGDGIRRNIAHVDPTERALFRDAIKQLRSVTEPALRPVVSLPLPGQLEVRAVFASILLGLGAGVASPYFTYFTDNNVALVIGFVIGLAALIGLVPWVPWGGADVRGAQLHEARAVTGDQVGADRALTSLLRFPGPKADPDPPDALGEALPELVDSKWNHSGGDLRDLRMVLDQRQVINRIATNLMHHHSLLRHRTWDGRGRILAKSPYLFRAKAIGNITRAALKGPRGRVGRNDEQAYANREEHYAREAGFFFDDLVAGFEALHRIEEGTLDPAKLRETVRRGQTQVLGPEFSMLHSESMVRALAGAWNELRYPSRPARAKKGQPEPVAAEPMSRREILSFFQLLEPLLHLDRPLTDESVWVKQTSAFLPGAKAPQGSSRAVSSLSQLLVEWARSGVPGA